MSSTLIKKVKIEDDYYELEWDKHYSFVIRENGNIINYCGRNEKLAKKKFSSKIYYEKKRRGIRK